MAKPNDKSVPWEIDSFKIGSLDGGWWHPDTGYQKLEKVPALAGADSEIINVAEAMKGATWRFTLEVRQAEHFASILLPPWVYVQWSYKQGNPAGRAVISTQDDAQRLVEGREIEVNWQKFENGEWGNFERGAFRLPQRYVWYMPFEMPYRQSRAVFASPEDADRFLNHETVQVMWQEFDGLEWIDLVAGGFRFEKYKPADSSQTP